MHSTSFASISSLSLHGHTIEFVNVFVYGENNTLFVLLDMHCPVAIQGALSILSMFEVTLTPNIWDNNNVWASNWSTSTP